MVTAMQRLRMGILLAALGAVGCAQLDLGPLPSTYVGPVGGGDNTASSLPRKVGASATNRPMPFMTPTTQGGKTLALSVGDAVMLALQNNPSLRVQRYNPQIFRTVEEQRRAAFDPVVSGQISGGRTDNTGQKNPSGTTGGVSDSISATVGYNQFLPTGTTINAGIDTNYSAQSFYSDSQVATRGGLTVTQALLKGASVEANLATVREAAVDMKISLYELRGVAESLVASIEIGYWDYVLAQRQIEIVKESLNVAQQQLDQTNELIRVGRLADTERIAAEAEVASRNEDVINAESVLKTTRLRLLRLVHPETRDFWTSEVETVTQPFIPELPKADVESHVNVALLNRSDVNQAKLLIDRGDLEVVRTKNGLLPKLDMFVALGKTGYAGSFGGSVTDLDGPSYDVIAGVKFEQALENRDARAQYRRSVLTKDQAMESLTNQTDMVQEDVRGAYIEVVRLIKQIDATGVTRKLQEEKLRTEKAKFDVGRSTNLLVAQAQRDLLSSKIEEVRAVANSIKALVTLYQLEGSLLERRGIEAPGK